MREAPFLADRAGEIDSEATSALPGPAAVLVDSATGLSY